MNNPNYIEWSEGSGKVFTLRPIRMHILMTHGVLPQSILTGSTAAWREQGKMSDADAASKIAQDVFSNDQRKFGEFMRDVVVFCSVNPHITDEPLHDGDEHPENIEDADFFGIFAWAMGGFAEAQRLASFRKGQERGTVGVGTNGAEIRKDAERIVKRRK